MLQSGPNSQQVMTVDRVHLFLLANGDDVIKTTFAPLHRVILTPIGEPLFPVSLFNVEPSCLIVLSS